MTSAPIVLTLAAVLLFASCASSPMGDGPPRTERVRVTDPPRGGGPRIVCVVAHPDDEIAFAGTVYKAATHLHAVCDLVVLTNGEAGFKYATLAERVYRTELTDEAVGRARLPEIRRQELLASAAVLGIRDVVLLRQRDHRYTKDPAEVIGPGGEWDVPAVKAALEALFATERYDFLLTHLPVPDTHGHHKAATILALEVVAGLPAAARPIPLGAWASGREQAAPDVPEELAGYPITRLLAGRQPFTFDRTQRFGYDDQLTYQVVVNWAIAAHRSQGTMQMMMGRWDVEGFYVYALAGSDAIDRTAKLFAALREPQFVPKSY